MSEALADESDLLTHAVVAACTGNVAAPSVRMFLGSAARTAVGQRPAHAIDLAPEKAAPGYLRGAASDYPIFVPFNLVAGFLPADLLHDLVAMGDLICVSPTSRMCISGSSTLLGDIEAVGDLDYCEYAIVRAEEVAAAVGRLAARTETPHLIEVKIGEEHLSHPWDACLPNAVELLRPPPSPAPPAKLDFVDDVARFGVLPITNVVLPVTEADPNGENAARSFAFQEVVVVRGEDYLPDLSDSARLADYAAFLRRELEAKVKTDPLKALKRGLSLLRLLGVRALTEEAVELINHPANIALMARKREEELRRNATKARPEVAQWLSSHLVNTSLPDGPEQVAEASVRQHAERISKYVNALFYSHERQSGRHDAE